MCRLSIGKGKHYLQDFLPTAEEDKHSNEDELCPKLLKVSHDIKCQIAKIGKKYTLGENLLKSVIVNYVKTILDTDAAA
jgi:hypothetical protein